MAEPTRVKPGDGDELRTDDGDRLRLGELIKSGGAGSVHRVPGVAGSVAKIYHADVDHAVYERKLRAMLRLSPRLPPFEEGGRTYVQIAWPQSLLHDSRGRFVGFTMPVVDFEATAELELVMQERQARAAGLATGLGAKVTLAANLAAVIAELHRQQHRVVDLKPVNLRFYRRSLYLAMLDCDGFSIQGEGERFPAPQYTGDYLAPELQRGGITVAGEEAQDRFALAVIVFQLLNFGIHPFTGRPRDDSVPTDVPSRVAARLYPYGSQPDRALLPNPGSGHLAFPPALRALFERAFQAPPASRPSPAEWAELLRGYAQRDRALLLPCERDPAHQHFAGLPCAACERQALIASVARGDPRARTGRGAAATSSTAPGAPPAPGVPATSRLKRPPLPASALKQARSSHQAGATRTAAKAKPARQSAAALARAKAALVQQQAQQQLSRVLGALVVVLFIAFVSFQSKQGVPAEDASPEGSALPASSPLPPTGLAAPPEYDPELAQRKVDALATANARGAREDAAAAMAALRIERGAAPRISDDGRLLDFGQRLLAADSYDADMMRRKAELALQDDAYDARAVCEWGWLALADGRLGAAHQAFVRAIWTEPRDGCGWLGIAAESSDEDVATGAMIQANLLQRYDAEDSAHRNRMVADVLKRAKVDAWLFLLVAGEADKRTPR